MCTTLINQSGILQNGCRKWGIPFHTYVTLIIKCYLPSSIGNDSFKQTEKGFETIDSFV